MNGEERPSVPSEKAELGRIWHASVPQPTQRSKQAELEIRNETLFA